MIRCYDWAKWAYNVGLDLCEEDPNMIKRRSGVVGDWMVRSLMVALVCAPALCSGAIVGSGDRAALKLEPAPKEVQLRDGGFRLGPRTRILVQLGHQSEDRIAAETLAEQVADQSGLRLDIQGVKASSKASDGTIVLARLDSKVRQFLARKGLKADEVVGEDGYILFASKTHLIVLAKTGQGLFYGVQTLRQLLRPEGKGLFCPSVRIRDWPGMDRRPPQDLTRGTQPPILQFHGPGA